MRKITQIIDVLSPAERRSAYIQVRNTSAKKKSRRLDLLKSMIDAADRGELQDFEHQAFSASDERQLQYLFQQVLDALVRIDNREEFQLYDRLKHIDVLLKYERYNLARQEIDRLKSDLLEDSQALVRLLTARQEALTIEKNATLDSLEEHYHKLKHRLDLIEDYHKEVEFEYIYMQLIFLHGKHPRGTGKAVIEQSLTALKLSRLEDVNFNNFVQQLYYYRSQALIHRLKEEPQKAADQLEHLKAVIGESLKDRPEKRHEYIETCYELGFSYIHADNPDRFMQELDMLRSIVESTTDHPQQELFQAYLYVMAVTGEVQFIDKAVHVQKDLLDEARAFVESPESKRNVHLIQTILFMLGVISLYNDAPKLALKHANLCYNTEDITRRSQLYLHLQFFRVLSAMLSDSWDFAEHTLNQLQYFVDKRTPHNQRIKPYLKVFRSAMQHTNHQQLMTDMAAARQMAPTFPEARFFNFDWLLAKH